MERSLSEKRLTIVEVLACRLGGRKYKGRFDGEGRRGD
jgi:hypothetical protein